MNSLKTALTAIAVGAALTATIASGETDTATKVDGSNTSAPAAGQTFKVGDTVKLGDWQAKVYTVTDPYLPANEFGKPKPGNRVVAVDAEVTNLSSKPQTVSSIACFQLQDGQNKSYNLTITGDSTAGLDGEIGAGAAKRGTLAYELPQSANGLKLQFKCNLLGSGSATIALS